MPWLNLLCRLDTCSREVFPRAVHLQNSFGHNKHLLSMTKDESECWSIYRKFVLGILPQMEDILWNTLMHNLSQNKWYVFTLHVEIMRLILVHWVNKTHTCHKQSLPTSVNIINEQTGRSHDGRMLALSWARRETWCCISKEVSLMK